MKFNKPPFFKKNIEKSNLTRNRIFIRKDHISFITLFVGLICIALAIISLSGRYLHKVNLYQLYPGTTPIQYNAALSFGIIGAGFLALLSPYKKAASIFGIAVATFGTLTLIEYFFNLNLGIDELFYKTDIYIGSSSPGRMSPNSALSFLACGVALTLLSFSRSSRIPCFIVLLLGMLVFTLGSISLLGYAANLPNTYQWAQLTPMAIQTAASFMLIGAGFMIYVYGKHVSGEVDLSPSAPYIAGAFILFLTSMPWAASLQRETDSIQETTSLESNIIQEKIKNKIKESVSKLQDLGFLTDFLESFPDKVSPASIENYRRKTSWYKTIEWVDPIFYSQEIASLQGKKRIQNHNFLHNSLTQEALKKAKEEGIAKISKITSLGPKDLRLFIYIPVFHESIFKGIIIGSIDINQILKEIIEEIKVSKFRFALFEDKDQKNSFVKSSINSYTTIQSTKEISLYNLQWVIKVWPSLEYLNEHMHYLFSRLTILMGVFISFLVFSTIRSQQSAKLQALLLQENMQELQYFKALTDDLQACSSLKMATHPIVKYCEYLFPSTSGTIYLANSMGETLTPFCYWGQKSIKPHSFPSKTCFAVQQRQLHYLSDESLHNSCEHIKKYPSEFGKSHHLCLPLLDQDGILGLLEIRDYSNPKGNSNNSILLAETLAQHLSLSISSLKLRDLLKDQAIRDPLTNLFNRRYLKEILEQEIHKAERYSRPLSIIMVDIDYFKKINDTYGHEVGDEVLKNLSHIFQKNYRKSDIICRFGGEEFIVVLPETPLHIAAQKAEELRKVVEELHFSFKGTRIDNLSVSMGVAEFPQHGHMINELTAAADQALYKAKGLGRNRVEVAPTSSYEEPH